MQQKEKESTACQARAWLARKATVSSCPGSSSTVRLQRSITSTPSARPALTRYL